VFGTDDTPPGVSRMSAEPLAARGRVGDLRDVFPEIFLYSNRCRPARGRTTPTVDVHHARAQSYDGTLYPLIKPRSHATPGFFHIAERSCYRTLTFRPPLAASGHFH